MLPASIVWGVFVLAGCAMLAHDVKPAPLGLLVCSFAVYAAIVFAHSRRDPALASPSRIERVLRSILAGLLTAVAAGHLAFMVALALRPARTPDGHPVMATGQASISALAGVVMGALAVWAAARARGRSVLVIRAVFAGCAILAVLALAR